MADVLDEKSSSSRELVVTLVFEISRPSISSDRAVTGTEDGENERDGRENGEGGREGGGRGRKGGPTNGRTKGRKVTRPRDRPDQIRSARTGRSRSLEIGEFNNLLRGGGGGGGGKGARHRAKRGGGGEGERVERGCNNIGEISIFN